jgi:hypothetical protein
MQLNVKQRAMSEKRNKQTHAPRHPDGVAGKLRPVDSVACGIAGARVDLCRLGVISVGSAQWPTRPECPLYVQQRPNIISAVNRRFVPLGDICSAEN